MFKVTDIESSAISDDYRKASEIIFIMIGLSLFSAMFFYFGDRNARASIRVNCLAVEGGKFSKKPSDKCLAEMGVRP